jgi:hypothetical protein
MPHLPPPPTKAPPSAASLAVAAVAAQSDERPLLPPGVAAPHDDEDAASGRVLISAEEWWLTKPCAGVGCISSHAMIYIILSCVLFSALVTTMTLRYQNTDYKINIPIYKGTFDNWSDPVGNPTLDRLYTLPIDMLFFVAMSAQFISNLLGVTFTYARCSGWNCGPCNDNSCNPISWYRRRQSWIRWGASVVTCTAVDTAVAMLCGLNEVFHFVMILAISLIGNIAHVAFENSVTASSSFSIRVFSFSAAAIAFAFNYVLPAYSLSTITKRDLVTISLALAGAIRLGDLVVSVLLWAFEKPNAKPQQQQQQLVYKKKGEYMEWYIVETLRLTMDCTLSLVGVMLLLWKAVRPV